MDSFGLLGELNGEVVFELGDQLWDELGFEEMKITEGKENPNVLFDIKISFIYDCRDKYLIALVDDSTLQVPRHYIRHGACQSSPLCIPFFCWYWSFRIVQH